MIHTGAGKINHTDAYLTDHVGMTAEAIHWLLDQGIKMTGYGCGYFRSSGFRLSLFPIKWVNTTGALVRAVAIVEE